MLYQMFYLGLEDLSRYATSVGRVLGQDRGFARTSGRLGFGVGPGTPTTTVAERSKLRQPGALVPQAALALW